jgi:hypothetical protein
MCVKCLYHVQWFMASERNNSKGLALYIQISNNMKGYRHMKQLKNKYMRLEQLE